MEIPYKNETINSPNGLQCTVLDTSKIDFTNALKGRKITKTTVRKAKAGELIETQNSAGRIESVYKTSIGDAIFTNLHNYKDEYVPSNPDGSRLQFSEIENNGYKIIKKNKTNDTITVKNTQITEILYQAIKEPTCIKNAWGENQHQFLFKDATLKKSPKGKITGIDKEAFDATWEIIIPTNTDKK